MPPPRAAVRAVNVGQSMTATDVRSRVGDTALRAAWIGLCVVLVLSPLRAWLDVGFDVGGWASPMTAWSLVAALVTLGFWVVSLAASPRRIRVGPLFVALPVAGLLVVSWLGIAVSIDPVLTAQTALVFALVTALGVYVLNEVDGIERLAIPLMAMVVVQAVVAIGQVVAQSSIGLTVARGAGPAVPSTAGSASSLLPTGQLSLRAYGLTDHPNVLGGILAFALIILASVRGLAGRRSTGRWVVFAVGVVALFLTFSRAALDRLCGGYRGRSSRCWP